jgi:L-2,4-diaminobutyrate transaminase
MRQTVSSDAELTSIDHVHVVHPFSPLRMQAQSPVVVIEGAEGVFLKDSTGRRFLDAAAGLWCANVGYGRGELVSAAAAQMVKVSYSHTFSNFSNEPMIRLSERVLRLAPANMSRVIFATSGSEANDTQIKLVRRYNNVRGKPAKKKIIARTSSYHGSTLGAASLTGLPMVHRTFDLPLPGILHTLAADYRRRPAEISSEEEFSRYLAEELERLIQAEGPETVAAFIAEPITAASGVLVPPAGYFREIQRVLRQYDILLILDEVVTGFGRTGSWFAGPELEAEPDLITVAKGLTGGYFPMSGCIISQRVSEVLYSETDADGMFAHGFTFSGHPVGAAVALANLDILERERLPENARSVGDYLITCLCEELDTNELVGEIRGRGLLIGIECEADRAMRKPFEDPVQVSGILGKACFDQGLLVRGAHGRVLAALAPPLILTRTEADEIVSRLKKALSQFADGLAASGLRS